METICTYPYILVIDGQEYELVFYSYGARQRFLIAMATTTAFTNCPRPTTHNSGRWAA